MKKPKTAPKIEDVKRLTDDQLLERLDVLCKQLREVDPGAFDEDDDDDDDDDEYGFYLSASGFEKLDRLRALRKNEELGDIVERALDALLEKN